MYRTTLVPRNDTTDGKNTQPAATHNLVHGLRNRSRTDSGVASTCWCQGLFFHQSYPAISVNVSFLPTSTPLASRCVISSLPSRMYPFETRFHLYRINNKTASRQPSKYLCLPIFMFFFADFARTHAQPNFKLLLGICKLVS